MNDEQAKHAERLARTYHATLADEFERDGFKLVLLAVPMQRGETITVSALPAPGLRDALEQVLAGLPTN